MSKRSNLAVVVLLMLSAAVSAIAQISVTSAQPLASPWQMSDTPAGGSFSPSLSADGRFVAFASFAKNLVPNQNFNLNSDVFVQDVVSNSTCLVSVSLSDQGGTGNSSRPIISSNGQFVAFLSTATNLVTGATNASPNLYLRDLAAGTTTLETIGTDGKVGPGYCTEFSMTPDGRFLLFVSTHTNLTTNTVTSVANVYVRDHLLATTELITVRATNPALSAASGGDSPSVSDDGQKVVFHSLSTDLGGPFDNVFLRDRATQTTLCIGTNSKAFNSSISRSYGATISGNGSNVVFVAAALTYSNAFYFDIPSGVTLPPTNISYTGSLTDISSDGRRILFHPDFAYSPASPDVLVWDAASNSTFKADTDTTQGHRTSLTSVLSSDGLRVAFISNVTNSFVSGAATVFELYVRELDSGITHLVTANTNGQPLGPGALISSPVFSADGHYLAFACDDDTLVLGDQNHSADIFLWSCDTGALQLISQRTPLRSPATDVASCVSGSFCISSNGQVLVFSSVDGYLLPSYSNRASDTNGWIDIFEFDTTSGQRALVSADFVGPLSTNGSAGTPVLSADGRYLAYLRNPGGSNLDVGNVYWRSLKGYTENLVSTNPAGVPIGNASALTISPDGRYIAYQTASPVSVGDSNTLLDVYAYDTQLEQNVYVTSSVTNYGSTNFGFTPDSQWILFQTRDSKAAGIDLQTTGPQLYARSLLSNVIQPITHSTTPHSDAYTNSAPTVSANSAVVAYVATAAQPNIFINGFNNTDPTPVCTNCTSPSLNFNGTKIAYVSKQGTRDQIYVKTIGSSQSNLVSVAYDQISAANNSCFNPLLSPDGRFVIFTSAANNLVTGTPMV